MTDLEAKLEELKEHKQTTDDRIAELEQQIAEAKKPKLRHGDYGFGGNWATGPNAFIYTDQSRNAEERESEKAYYDNRMGQINVNHAKHPVLGNIFDDLAAMAEDVTLKTPDLHINHADDNFGSQDIRVGVAKDETTYLCVDDENFHATEEELRDIHLFIGRRLATLKRQQK